MEQAIHIYRSDPAPQPANRELAALLGRMRRAAGLSKTNEKLAAYVGAHYMQVIFMTAGQLAGAVGVSQGSVSRFCINLAFRGYNDFLHYLRECVSKELTLPERLRYTTEQPDGVEEILKTEHANIDAVGRILQTPEYAQLKQKLSKAKTLVLLSARMSATLLPYTFYLFNKIRSGVESVMPGDPQWDTLELLDPKETYFLGFVFPRYANVLLDKLRSLRAKGFDVGFLTDVNFPYMEGLSAGFLRIPTTVHSIFDIYSAPILFVNLLIRDLAKESRHLKARLDRLEEIESGLYYKEP